MLFKHKLKCEVLKNASLCFSKFKSIFVIPVRAKFSLFFETFFFCSLLFLFQMHFEECIDWTVSEISISKISAMNSSNKTKKASFFSKFFLSNKLFLILKEFHFENSVFLITVPCPAKLKKSKN